MPRTGARLVLYVAIAAIARVAALPPLKRSLRPQHGALTVRGGSTKKTVTRNPRAVVVQKRTDVLGASFNLVNNVAGCGFLTLTAGAAGTGYLPAIGLVAFFGAVSCGSFLLLGEDALRYQASDVRSLWSEAVGANAWAVDASVAAFFGAAAGHLPRDCGRCLWAPGREIFRYSTINHGLRRGFIGLVSFVSIGPGYSGKIFTDGLRVRLPHGLCDLVSSRRRHLC